MGAPARRTVLLIHGYMDGGETWDRLVAHLRAGCLALGDAAFVAPTLKEVLPPPETSAQTLERFRDQALAALASCTPEGEVIIIGHSMGGAVAELVALALGERAARLILITPVPLAGAKLSPEVRQRFMAGLADRSPERMRAAREALSSNLDEDALVVMCRTASAVTESGALQQLDAWDGGHPLGEARSHVRCPVLIVATDDPFFGQDLLRTQARRFDSAEVRYISDAGHWSHMEQATALSESICRFLAVDSSDER